MCFSLWVIQNRTPMHLNSTDQRWSNPDHICKSQLKNFQHFTAPHLSLLLVCVLDMRDKSWTKALQLSRDIIKVIKGIQYFLRWVHVHCTYMYSSTFGWCMQPLKSPKSRSKMFLFFQYFTKEQSIPPYIYKIEMNQNLTSLKKLNKKFNFLPRSTDRPKDGQEES